MNHDSKIVVFGADGLIGKEIVSQLKTLGYGDVIACNHSMLDLINQSEVYSFFSQEKPEYVFFCAVRSITNFDEEKNIDAVEAYSNIMMQLNTMEACKIYKVKKAVFLGSAMLYPWNNEHPDERLREEFLEDFNIGQYRPSMQSSVLSKFVCMKMCEYYNAQYGTKFVYAIPAHIYGGYSERKNLYFLENMVISICNAKLENINEVYLDVFGEGRALKQFMHVSDCANAIIAIMEKYEDYKSPINIASETPENWRSITEMICEIVGWNGKIKFNSEHKENMANRLCSVEKMKNLGWKQEITMKQGLTMLVEEYMRMKRGSSL